MSVTLQFSAGNDFESNLIKWFGGGPAYSHVDIVLPDGNLLGARSDKCGDIPPGVQIRPSDYLAGQSTFQIKVPSYHEDHEKEFYAFLAEQVGKPYDALAIAAFVVGRNWRCNDAWFCSELAAAALEYSRLIFPLAAPANKVTPGDLLLVLSSFVDLRYSPKIPFAITAPMLSADEYRGQMGAVP